jgi:hypothetical protein
LLPLFIVGLGGPVGGWHCADGSVCASAVEPTCCCGCVETGSRIVHHCDDEEARAPYLGADACGCYYQTQYAEALLKLKRLLASDVPALLATHCVTIRPLQRIVCLPAPAATQSPPRTPPSPGDPRGPPAA